MSSGTALYDEQRLRGRTATTDDHPTAFLLTFAHRAQVDDRVSRLLSEIDALAELPDDWDGDESPSVEPAAIRRANWFVENMRVGWLPLVGANTLGGVRVEWDAGKGYLIVDFEPGGETQVMFAAPGQVAHVWRNDEIPGDLAFCFAEVDRVRRGS